MGISSGVIERPILDDVEPWKVREVVRELERWLKIQALPAHSVVWYPHWRHDDMTVVADAAALIACIAPLPNREYGGVKRLGSAGPWAQVMGDGKGLFLVELHPHEYGDEPDDGMYFERILDVSAAVAGEVCWAWVRGKDLPEGIELEPRVVPPGKMLDRPL